MIMRAVVQRVSRASVSVDGQIVGSIGRGLLALIGVAADDDSSDAVYIADKLIGLRIFEDEAVKMNLSTKEIGGSVLMISQFTLLGDCRKGRRPSFIHAAEPAIAEALYRKAVDEVQKQLPVQTGRFQAMMQVELINEGPVTVMIDSRKAF
jgi:D-tyrosyl-tRNA(Tyr) deacylase